VNEALQTQAGRLVVGHVAGAVLEHRGEELPLGGFRGDEELPPGGFRGDEELPPGGFRG